MGQCSSSGSGGSGQNVSQQGLLAGLMCSIQEARVQSEIFLA